MRRSNTALLQLKHKTRMADWPSFNFAPRPRGGCLPFGEARGGDLALSELPHPCHVLLSRCKGNTFSIICKTQLYPKGKKPVATGCRSSSSETCLRSCKYGLQGSGIHVLSSQIFSKSSRKRFDNMSLGATGDGLVFTSPSPCHLQGKPPRLPFCRLHLRMSTGFHCTLVIPGLTFPSFRA